MLGFRSVVFSGVLDGQSFRRIRLDRSEQLGVLRPRIPCQRRRGSAGSRGDAWNRVVGCSCELLITVEVNSLKQKLLMAIAEVHKRYKKVHISIDSDYGLGT